MSITSPWIRVLNRSKTVAKFALAKIVSSYICLVRLDATKAEYWSQVIKRWPAVFACSMPRKTVEVAGGLRMNVGLVDMIERSLWVTGSWEPHVLQLLEKKVSAGDVVLDIGANIGFLTMFASRLVGPKGLVISIEPCHNNISKLCENLVLNDLANVVVLSSAAGEVWKKGDICFAGAGNSGATEMRGARVSRKHAVLELPLDALRAGGFRPSLIKIDIEGYELLALRGLRKTLESCKPIVVLELTDRFLRELGQSAVELLSFMEDMGYECRLLADCSVAKRGDTLTSKSDVFSDLQVDVCFVPVDEVLAC